MIIDKDAIDEEDKERTVRSLFCFKSFFNHSSQSNVKIELLSSNLIFIFAKQDIQAGQELSIDYRQTDTKGPKAN